MTDIKSYELNTLNGKIIGVYEHAIEKRQRLRNFLQLNNLQCGIRTYSSEEIEEDGNMYRFLESGEVDLLLGNESEADNYRVAAEFPAQPYYVVTHEGNDDILDGLNLGLEKILNSDPKFAEEHYEKNFNNINNSKIQLSKPKLEL